MNNTEINSSNSIYKHIKIIPLLSSVTAFILYFAVWVWVFGSMFEYYGFTSSIGILISSLITYDLLPSLILIFLSAAYYFSIKNKNENQLDKISRISKWIFYIEVAASIIMLFVKFDSLNVQDNLPILGRVFASVPGNGLLGGLYSVVKDFGFMDLLSIISDALWIFAFYVIAFKTKSAVTLSAGDFSSNETKTTMYCRNCGKELPSNSVFCPNCGIAVNH